MNIRLDIDAGTFKGMYYEGPLDKCPSYLLLNEHRYDCAVDEKAENVRSIVRSLLSIFRYITYCGNTTATVSVMVVD